MFVTQLHLCIGHHRWGQTMQMHTQHAQLSANESLPLSPVRALFEVMTSYARCLLIILQSLPTCFLDECGSKRFKITTVTIHVRFVNIYSYCKEITFKDNRVCQSLLIAERFPAIVETSRSLQSRMGSTQTWCRRHRHTDTL